MKNSIIVLLFSGVLFHSCTTSSSDELEKISLPLKVGNSWTYDVFITDFQENPITVRQEKGVTFTVLSDTVVDGVQWYYIESDVHEMNFCKAGYYSNQEDGIYFMRWFDVNQSKTYTGVTPLTLSELSSNTVSNVQENGYPFLHHPDTEIPDRLIKNESVIASVSYTGESINEQPETRTENYIWNYYQQSVGIRAYAINPFDLNFSVSNEVGFTVYEGAYISSLGSTEDDPRLQLLSLYRYELTEFNEN